MIVFFRSTSFGVRKNVIYSRTSYRLTQTFHSVTMSNPAEDKAKNLWQPKLLYDRQRYTICSCFCSCHLNISIRGLLYLLQSLHTYFTSQKSGGALTATYLVFQQLDIFLKARRGSNATLFRKKGKILLWPLNGQDDQFPQFSMEWTESGDILIHDITYFSQECEEEHNKNTKQTCQQGQEREFNGRCL